MWKNIIKRISSMEAAFPKRKHFSPILIVERNNFDDPDEYLTIRGQRMTPAEGKVFIAKYFEYDDPGSHGPAIV